MKSAIFCALFLSSFAYSATKPLPNGPLKVFRGPEGELIGMVEVNQAKQMLVHFKNIGGDLDGKTKMYEFADNGRQGKEVYFIHQWRKSKTRPWIVLAYTDGAWKFANPSPGSTQTFRLTYSQSDTDKMKLEDVVNSYKP